MTKYNQRKLCFFIIGLLTAFLSPELGIGIIFSVIMFGVGTRVRQSLHHDLNFLTGDDDIDWSDGDPSPNSHDGPWAEGWEDRCGEEYLKEAFRKAKNLAHFVRNEVGD